MKELVELRSEAFSTWVASDIALNGRMSRRSPSGSSLDEGLMKMGICCCTDGSATYPVRSSEYIWLVKINQSNEN